MNDLSDHQRAQQPLCDARKPLKKRLLKMNEATEQTRVNNCDTQLNNAKALENDNQDVLKTKNRESSKNDHVSKTVTTAEFEKDIADDKRANTNEEDLVEQTLTEKNREKAIALLKILRNNSPREPEMLQVDQKHDIPVFKVNI